jgi:hypothetical protein
MNTIFRTCIALACCSVLAAGCGGGDDDEPQAPPPTEQVPPGASTSVQGFIEYVKALVGSEGTEALEPVDTSTVTPPLDETSEPQAVD